MNVGSSKLPFLKLHLFKLPVYSNSTSRADDRHGSPYTPVHAFKFTYCVCAVVNAEGLHFSAFYYIIYIMYTPNKVGHSAFGEIAEMSTQSRINLCDESPQRSVISPEPPNFLKCTPCNNYSTL